MTATRAMWYHTLDTLGKAQFGGTMSETPTPTTPTSTPEPTGKPLPTAGTVVQPVPPVRPVQVKLAPPPTVNVGKVTGKVTGLAKAVVQKQIVKVKAQLDELVNTIILYGDSGLGKSTEAVHFAKWMYERHGKPLGLVTSETSCQKIFESAIKTGIVKAFFVPSAENPLAAMRKLTRGFWPTGSGDTTEWKEPNFCGYICEGLTSIAQTLLEQVRDEGRLLREQRDDSWEFGDETFTPASQSAYGFVQAEMLRHMRAFAGLAGVKRVLWTAHEGFIGKAKLACGPATVGQATISDMPKNCGMLLHFENYPQEATVAADGAEKLRVSRKRVRAWFEEHYDTKNAGLKFFAKLTIPDERVPELYGKFPNSYFDVKLNGGSLANFLTIEEELARGHTEAMAEWKRLADEKRNAQPVK